MRFSTKKDIEEIITYMEGVHTGRISRNKNYYTLLESNNNQKLFRRAKLFVSLIRDIEETSHVMGNKIWVDKVEDEIEVNLYNPTLRYRRRVLMTEEELSAIQSQTKML